MFSAPYRRVAGTYGAYSDDDIPRPEARSSAPSGAASLSASAASASIHAAEPPSMLTSKSYLELKAMKTMNVPPLYGEDAALARPETR